MKRQLTRRQALGAAGTAGAAYLASGTGLGELLTRLGTAPDAAAATAARAASCTTLTPDMTEGPYWIDGMLHRANVTANTATATSQAGAVQAGVPLELEINVLDATCAPINGAHVDIWHANANGTYSGEGGQQAGGGGAASADTSGQNFLRGYQITGQDTGSAGAPVDGQVAFRTIWPGWYAGRAIHIHVRVRTYSASGAVVTNYTTQIFFSDAANNTVLNAASPYKTPTPTENPTTDETDNILASSARATNIVGATGSVAAGFKATFDIMLSGTHLGTTGSATDKAVQASLGSAKVMRASNGARTLVLTVEAGEPVTARVRIVRGSTVLGHATGHLTGGSHTVRTAIAPSAAAGKATAELTLTDAAGNSRLLTRQITIPARR
jgi:protocatechuate 3,4-dioxygenase beta subunit